MQIRCGFRVMIALAAAFLAVPFNVVAGEGERRGEIGVQVGTRWADGDLVPEGSNGREISWGFAGAWAFSQKWAIFGDVNTSVHDSIELCTGAEFCSARTPEVEFKVVTVGMERRLKKGPKGGQWVFGLGTGMMDLEWNGIQVHHGILSLNVGRRVRLGPGAARLTLRAETGFSGRTDNQLEGAYEDIRVTNVVLLVGWGAGFGSRH